MGNTINPLQQAIDTARRIAEETARRAAEAARRAQEAAKAQQNAAATNAQTTAAGGSGFQAGGGAAGTRLGPVQAASFVQSLSLASSAMLNALVNRPASNSPAAGPYLYFDNNPTALALQDPAIQPAWHPQPPPAGVGYILASPEHGTATEARGADVLVTANGASMSIFDARNALMLNRPEVYALAYPYGRDGHLNLTNGQVQAQAFGSPYLQPGQPYPGGLSALVGALPNAAAQLDTLLTGSSADTYGPFFNGTAWGGQEALPATGFFVWDRDQNAGAGPGSVMALPNGAQWAGGQAPTGNDDRVMYRDPNGAIYDLGSVPEVLAARGNGYAPARPSGGGVEQFLRELAAAPFEIGYQLITAYNNTPFATHLREDFAVGTYGGSPTGNVLGDVGIRAYAFGDIVMLGGLDQTRQGAMNWAAANAQANATGTNVWGFNPQNGQFYVAPLNFITNGQLRDSTVLAGIQGTGTALALVAPFEGQGSFLNRARTNAMATVYGYTSPVTAPMYSGLTQLGRPLLQAVDQYSLQSWGLPLSSGAGFRSWMYPAVAGAQPDPVMNILLNVPPAALSPRGDVLLVDEYYMTAALGQAHPDQFPVMITIYNPQGTAAQGAVTDAEAMGYAWYNAKRTTQALPSFGLPGGDNFLPEFSNLPGTLSTAKPQVLSIVAHTPGDLAATVPQVADQIAWGGQVLSPEQFAGVLQDLGVNPQNVTQINLIACNTGVQAAPGVLAEGVPLNYAFGQELANEMGIPVLAPLGPVQTGGTGPVVVWPNALASHTPGLAAPLAPQSAFVIFQPQP